MDDTGSRGGWWVGIACLLLLVSGSARAQTVRAGELELDFTGRVQVQLNTTSVDGDDVAEPPASSAFETRRVRLGTGVRYGDWITGEVEVDFANGGARLTDGFVDFALADALHLQAGQFKKPFGVIELESSTRIRTIERGLRIRGIDDLVGLPGETQLLLDESRYLGRQIGVMAHGAVGALGYAAGVFNGEGANTDETAGSKAYAGRVTYRVAGPLVLGSAVSVQPTGAFDGDDEVRGTAVALEATWGGFRRPGLHAKAEWMVGDNAAASFAVEPPTMRGVHGLVAWFAPRSGRVEGIEPVFRLSWADPDTDVEEDSGVLLTPGVNLYFDGRNRLMVNGDVYLPGQDDLDPELAMVAQIQVYF